MSRIFLSHASSDNAAAVALTEWLSAEGWRDDLFLDLDPERGIAAGDRWERALLKAADRCEAVIFLISEAWLSSRWCQKEFAIAYRLNKRLFGVLIQDLENSSIPRELTGTWQTLNLASGRDLVEIVVEVPITHETATVSFSREGLVRLKRGLQVSGLDPRYFAWPPKSDPLRAPYRGLLTYETCDAGIFFGRDGVVLEALEQLRAMRASGGRLLTILGASGSGKSSFLRAGVLPRLMRDEANYLVLPVIRPANDVMGGDAGLQSCLREALIARGLADVSQQAIKMGAEGVLERLRALVAHDRERQLRETSDAPPQIILPLDQAEELFPTEERNGARKFLEILAAVSAHDDLPIVTVCTIRSDAFDRLQLSPHLASVSQKTMSLAPIPVGAFGDVIRGPAKRYSEAVRPMSLDDRLVDALLGDVLQDGAKDALPLLSFTMERLFHLAGRDGRLDVADYDRLGRIGGSINAAAEIVLTTPLEGVTASREGRLELLRKALVPALATVDAESGQPRRLSTRLDEVPSESRALIDLMVSQRLLTIDHDGASAGGRVEPAHEALLRQWPALAGWLASEREFLMWRDEIDITLRRWESARARGSKEDARQIEAAGRALAQSSLWESGWQKLPLRMQEFLQHTRRRGRLAFVLAMVIAFPFVSRTLFLFGQELWGFSQSRAPIMLMPPTEQFELDDGGSLWSVAPVLAVAAVHLLVTLVILVNAMRPLNALRGGFLFVGSIVTCAVVLGSAGYLLYG